MQKTLDVNIEMLTEHKSVLDCLGRSQEVLALFNDVAAPLLREVCFSFEIVAFSYYLYIYISSSTLL